MSPLIIPLLSALFLYLLLPSTTAKPYTPTDYLLLNCGTSANTTSSDNRNWASDADSKFSATNIATISSSFTATQQHPSLPDRVPYMTARVSNTTLTYTFPVSAGPKFLRLYFYPATYANLNITKSFFSLSANGFSLLTNFSAFLTVSFHDPALPSPLPYLIKEFMINIKNTQFLNLTFSPSPNSFAFINGIEIVSQPENLYIRGVDLNLIGQNDFNQNYFYKIDNNTAFETVYRLNVGGNDIAVTDDTGMFRKWENDVDYIYGAATGVTPNRQIPIHYTAETPNYIAPEQVYTSSRTMGHLSLNYNLTWFLPVDSGFHYLLRLHFCNIIPEYNRTGDVVFKNFIYSHTVEEEADVLSWTPGSGYPVFRDYIVKVENKDVSKQDLSLAMHPNVEASARRGDAMLNGLEIFKLTTSDGSLDNSNPEFIITMPPPPPMPAIFRGKKKSNVIPVIFGAVAGVIALFWVLIFLVCRQRRRTKKHVASDIKSTWATTSSESRPLPSDGCRHFSLEELKSTTCNFDDNFVIGRGGFGKVYKGYIDNGETAVAIKRLNPLSNQGVDEFQTEIGMLSKLRHGHLVSLIGYCNKEGEMILVYDYMIHGTLREHLYNTKNPPLSWNRRLQICIGAAKGLHYLHTGVNRTIIHRDVKSTNILLDEKWVAKVSDFGLSKMGPEDMSQGHVSTMVKGSFGYIDPQYYIRQQLTNKSDVYSFGVVLFEVLCARPAILHELPEEQVVLANWAKSCYRRGDLARIIDTKLRGEIASECLRKFGEIATNCLAEQCIERPKMNDVVSGLEFVLQLQESAKKIGGIEATLDNEEYSFFMNNEEPTTTLDDAIFKEQTKLV